MRLSLRAKIFIILFFLFVGGIITVFSLPESESEIKFNEKKKAFFNETIKGVIYNADIVSHHDYFKLDNGNDYYYKWDLKAYDNLPNDGGYAPDKYIGNFAEKGDSVIKEANTNFFMLKKKNGETFIYYFLLD